MRNLAYVASKGATDLQVRICFSTLSRLTCPYGHSTVELASPQHVRFTHHIGNVLQWHRKAGNLPTGQIRKAIPRVNRLESTALADHLVAGDNLFFKAQS